MDSVEVRISVDGISNTLNHMLDRGKLARGWLNRYAYPKLIEAQRMRWASEGASEGDSWVPLNPSYAIRKLKKYAAYPGSGTKMLVATGRLVESVTGDNQKEHFKFVTDTELQMGTIVPYAGYVSEVRDIVGLGDETIQDLKDSLREYLQT